MYILLVGSKEKARQNVPFVVVDDYYRAHNGYCVKTDIGVVQEIEGLIEEVPNSITQRQCRLQLVKDGDYQAVLDAIESLGAEAQIEWEYANDIQRSNHLVSAIQDLLGKTDAEMDEFFIDASVL